ncbi:MAG: hypothetical protein HFG80_10110 [Eubacterium sp.]|nr:hypothetical protein [Eubacterium sp.]
MSIVSNEQIIKVLRQYNPWWRTASSIREESKPNKQVPQVLFWKKVRQTAVQADGIS